jgi:hypothetical protein
MFAAKRSAFAWRAVGDWLIAAVGDCVYADVETHAARGWFCSFGARTILNGCGVGKKFFAVDRYRFSKLACIIQVTK